MIQHIRFSWQLQFLMFEPIWAAWSRSAWCVSPTVKRRVSRATACCHCLPDHRDNAIGPWRWILGCTAHDIRGQNKLLRLNAMRSHIFRDSSTASRWCHGDTVDGRNPAPVHRWFIPLFTGFFYIPGGAGFLPSTVSFRRFRDAVFDFQLMSSHGSWYWLTSSGFERGTRTLQRLSLHLRPSCSAGTSASKIPRNWSVVVAGGFEKLHASLFAVHWFRLFHYIPWCFDTKLCIIQCL